ncbi:chromosomal replication initiator protein DnaA [Spiroplasma endosymbiont of Anurida maritima]|uniref:chromosomal replication initiator protein DnaA n=1 Tax=Spiroplasma endosymbiont of Anurida maritima TaxID=2967972 RepID=UPI0036D23465
MNNNVWDDVKEILAKDETIDSELYNRYFKNTYFGNIIDNNIIIVCKNKITISILKAGLNNKIERILFNTNGIQYKLHYELEAEFKNNKTNENLNILKEKKIIEDNQEQEDSDNKLEEFSKKYTFDRFIKGDSNNIAFHAALSVTREIGNKWNPLFIYGDSGLGKTHLLFSIKNKIVNEDKNHLVKYLNADEFGKLALDVLKDKNHLIEEFKTSYNKYDCLLIDDIQLLAKRSKTNELFFYIFNSFIEKNKQIVITSDKYPDELDGFESRIISRFSNGLSVELKSPDFETALIILKEKIKEFNLSASIHNDALEYIALNFKGDVRKIEGAVKRLLFLTLINNKKDFVFTLENVKSEFGKIAMSDNEKITFKKIKKVVANEYQVTIKSMVSKSRIKMIREARQLAMYFCRILLDEPLNKIGNEFGGRDHTTVINSIRKIDEEIAKDKNFKKYVNSIKEKIEK